MTVYRFKNASGELYKFDTDKATLLLCTRWRSGREQTRWREIYQTKSGRYACVERSQWLGEDDVVYELERGDVLYHLAMAEEHQRTEAGEALLAAEDPCVEL